MKNKAIEISSIIRKINVLEYGVNAVANRNRREIIVRHKRMSQ